MNKKQLIDRMINHEGKRADTVWCALCEDHNVKATVIAPWISPEGKLVCIYGACSKCGDAVESAPTAIRTKLMTKVEQQLLARYPALFEKLPKNYSPSPVSE